MSRVVTLGLCGGVLAVDGVAVKQVVNRLLASVPESEKTACFAPARSSDGSNAKHGDE